MNQSTQASSSNYSMVGEDSFDGDYRYHSSTRLFSGLEADVEFVLGKLAKRFKILQNLLKIEFKRS